MSRAAPAVATSARGSVVVCAVLNEFSVRQVTLSVLEHLETRRAALVDQPAHIEAIEAEVRAALVPVRAAYGEAELPPGYLGALEREVTAAVPAAWRSIATAFTRLEARQFGVWRGGDPVARATYVLLGLVLGGLLVALPFVPIWEKWFPFALAISAFWLPTAQIAFQKRRYARALGEIALRLECSQPRLDALFSTEALLTDRGETPPAESRGTR